MRTRRSSHAIAVTPQAAYVQGNISMEPVPYVEMLVEATEESPDSGMLRVELTAKESRRLAASLLRWAEEVEADE